jgi:OmcA/MtrC family decaheme c-type cytochrome
MDANAVFNLSRWRLLASALVVSLSLAGCEGDDGKDGTDGAPGAEGPQGEQGEQGPTGPAAPSAPPTEFSGEFTSAVVNEDGSLTVQFYLENELEQAYVGLPQGNIRFTVAKLVPEDTTGLGDASFWQSYINRTESAPTDPELGPGTEDTTQATYERDGVLTDNGDGTYSYTYSVNLSSVTEPVAVAYEPDFTHRVAIQISGGLPVFNATYSWQPSTDTTDGIHSREIVVEETCNSCHGELAIHGGGRIDTAYCVTCHNPGTTDANSGNTVDFKQMVHKIHRGRYLYEVEQGGEYAIWGFRNSKHDYSEVGFPQDIRRCSNCHDDSNEATPDAANWYEQPTMEACGSCHDNIDFTLAGTDPNGHKGGPQDDNSLCSSCHGPLGGFPVEGVHEGVLANKRASADDLMFEAVAVRESATTPGNLVATIRITNADAPVAAIADVAQYLRVGDHAYVLFNWDDGTGYQMSYLSMTGSGLVPSNLQYLSDCVATATVGDYDCEWVSHTLANGGAPLDVNSGTLAVTFAEMSVCVDEDTQALTACPDPAADADGYPVDGIEFVHAPFVRTYFDLSTAGKDITEDYAEKFGADFDSCNGCHGTDPLHNTSHPHAATNFAQCTSCHNATRAGLYAGRPADLKSHVHTFHANRDQGHEGLEYFPDDVSNCIACHADGQFDLPILQNDRPSRAAANPFFGPQTYTSPTAVVCSSCHLSVPVGFIGSDGKAVAGDPLTAEQQHYVNHLMVTGGAVFGAATPAEATATEACAVCHAIGTDQAVDEVHNLR